MVLLTMTPPVVAAIRRYESLADVAQLRTLQPDGHPQLDDPAPGRPISHVQIIAISDFLRARADQRIASGDESAAVPFALDHLLRGSRLYTPPLPPKPEPSNEYKELMARLRREEEARAYERMISPPVPAETYAQRFAHTNVNLCAIGGDSFVCRDEDDDVTYADINRQLALIINVLVSIIACSVAIWIAARYWSTPARLALSMTGSGVVAIAEVGIYMGYLRRIKEAKTEEKKKPEIKEIAETWVIEGGDAKKSLAVQRTTLDRSATDAVRQRKKKAILMN